MASQIPKASDLGTRKFSGDKKILDYSTKRPGSFSGSFRDAMSVVDAFQGESDKATDFEVAEAEANFTIDKIGQDSAYEHDQDYETIGERYNESLNSSLDKHAATIRNTDKRNSFLNRNKVKVAAGKSRADDIAFRRGKDIKRGRMNTALNKIKETAIKGSNSDFTDVVSAAENLFDSAEYEDLYGAEEASKVRAVWRNDLSKSKLKSMKPRDALNAMSMPFIKDNLDIDDQVSLKNHFEEKVLDQDAMDWVDDNYSKGIEEARVLTAKIADPDLRFATEKRLQYKHNTVQRDFAIEQDELYRGYGGKVIDGETTVDQIRQGDPEAWDKMTVPMKQNLINTQANVGKRPTNTSFEDVANFHALLGSAKRSGNYRDVMAYVQNNSSRFSQSDMKKWTEIAIDGSMPIEVDSGLTNQQMMMAQLPASSSKDEKSQLLGKIGDFNIRYMENNNKEPNDKEIQAEINRLLMERDTSAWWGGGVSVFKMDDRQTAIENKVSAYAAEKGLDMDGEKADELYQTFSPVSDKVIQGFRDIGVESPSESQFNRAFDMELKAMGY